jgi:hypothetical protein
MNISNRDSFVVLLKTLIRGWERELSLIANDPIYEENRISLVILINKTNTFLMNEFGE